MSFIFTFIYDTIFFEVKIKDFPYQSTHSIIYPMASHLGNILVKNRFYPAIEVVLNLQGHDDPVLLHWLLNRCIIHLKISETFVH